MNPPSRLHGADYPHTLGVLYALFADRLTAAAAIGFRLTDTGALVDWDALGGSWLSSTEKATVTIAAGLAVMEHHGGGLPHWLASPVRDAVEALT